MMLYMASNTRPDISFAVHQYEWFTNNTKASHDSTVKSIFLYVQGTKDKGLVFNPSKETVVGFCVDDDFQGFRGIKNPRSYM